MDTTWDTTSIETSMSQQLILILREIFDLLPHNMCRVDSKCQMFRILAVTEISDEDSTCNQCTSY